jgi:hypothetical protein
MKRQIIAFSSLAVLHNIKLEEADFRPKIFRPLNCATSTAKPPNPSAYAHQPTTRILRASGADGI